MKPEITQRSWTLSLVAINDTVPAIKIIARWLNDLGFSEGRTFRVQGAPGRLVLIPRRLLGGCSFGISIGAKRQENLGGRVPLAERSRRSARLAADRPS
jgi:hypothetical protein